MVAVVLELEIHRGGHAGVRERLLGLGGVRLAVVRVGLERVHGRSDHRE